VLRGDSRDSALIDLCGRAAGCRMGKVGLPYHLLVVVELIL
jgi:hypothetical protein